MAVSVMALSGENWENFGVFVFGVVGYHPICLYIGGVKKTKEMVLFVVSVLCLVLAGFGVVARSFDRLVVSPSFVAWGVFVVWFAFLGWIVFELGVSFWYAVVPALVAVAWIGDDKV